MINTKMRIYCYRRLSLFAMRYIATPSSEKEREKGTSATTRSVLTLCTTTTQCSYYIEMPRRLLVFVFTIFSSSFRSFFETIVLLYPVRLESEAQHRRVAHTTQTSILCLCSHCYVCSPLALAFFFSFFFVCRFARWWICSARVYPVYRRNWSVSRHLQYSAVNTISTKVSPYVWIRNTQITPTHFYECKIMLSYWLRLWLRRNEVTRIGKQGNKMPP